jgi:hypothetical protein
MNDDEILNLKNILLETLSFYEEMDFHKIVLDLSAEVVKKNPDLNREKIEIILDLLEKEGLVKKNKFKEEYFYIRQMPKKKKSFWQKVFG